MEIKLKINFKLPERYKDANGLEVNQLVFDAFMNYVVCKHLEDALQVMANSDFVPEHKEIIVESHKEWAEAFKHMHWTLDYEE